MPGPLRRLLWTVGALALVAQAVALAVLHGEGAVFVLQPSGVGLLHGGTLALVCLGLTLAADWVAVRVQHGDEVEELTLFEAACVVDVLLLPAHWALLVPVLATVLCSTIRGRGAVKILFNGANLALAVVLLVFTVHVLAEPGEGLSLRTVVALTLGMLGLTGVNLVALSRVMGAVGGGNPRVFVREGARLSTVIAVGTVAIGGTAVTLADAAPALLPFALMPAFALTFAFRAAAQESEERDRSRGLLRLSHVLAGRLDEEEMLEAFLDLTRQAFGVDVALAVLNQAEGPMVAVVDDRREGRGRRPASLTEQDLVGRSARGGSQALRADLPRGWRSALITPLESEGRQVGVLALASADKRRALSGRELNLLTSLVSALGVALRGAAHLRRLEEERGKLTAVVDQSSDGILMLDGAGRVQLWSPALARVTGIAEADAVGQDARVLLAHVPEDGEPPRGLGLDELSPSNPRTTVELRLRRQDGLLRVVSCAHAGVFDPDGALERDVVIVHDITREREVERLKADFIATVSHELRTPITPIKGYADLLTRRGHAMSDKQRTECLNVISDRAQHLNRLVEDLLLASRLAVSEGKVAVDLCPDDLGALVARAAGDAADERVVAELPDAPVVAVCDAVRVGQVLGHLLSNALKFSPAEAPVLVTMRAADGHAVVEVSDQGRGIPEDQLERVFDKFHRVEDSLVMTTGGSGLGLYLARQLATAMKGTVSCRSTLGKGSVFTLRLPLGETAVPAPRPGDAERAVTG
jgi:PAS domain S-box-containing protein